MSVMIRALILSIPIILLVGSCVKVAGDLETRVDELIQSRGEQ